MNFIWVDTSGHCGTTCIEKVNTKHSILCTNTYCMRYLGQGNHTVQNITSLDSQTTSHKFWCWKQNPSVTLLYTTVELLQHFKHCERSTQKGIIIPPRQKRKLHYFYQDFKTMKFRLDLLLLTGVICYLSSSYTGKLIACTLILVVAMSKQILQLISQLDLHTFDLWEHTLSSSLCSNFNDSRLCRVFRWISKKCTIGILAK